VYRASNRPLVNLGDAPHQKSTNVPADIWRAFMTSAESGQPIRQFARPAWTGAAKNFAAPSPFPTGTPPTVRRPNQEYVAKKEKKEKKESPPFVKPTDTSRPTARPTAKRPNSGQDAGQRTPDLE
jgi:membrane peptidoglycan carboxypeptidase